MTLNDPFVRHPEVPTFMLESSTVLDGAAWGAEQMSGLFGVPGGEDRSPHLRWHGAPADTTSFAITVLDPDAPTGSGFWHWAVANIPATTRELPEGAGDPSSEQLPAG